MYNSLEQPNNDASIVKEASLRWAGAARRSCYQGSSSWQCHESVPISRGDDVGQADRASSRSNRTCSQAMTLYLGTTVLQFGTRAGRHSYCYRA